MIIIVVVRPFFEHFSSNLSSSVNAVVSIGVTRSEMSRVWHSVL